MSKSSLGKGLSSLLGEKQDTSRLALHLLTPGTFQPRKRFSENELKELAISIQKNGLLQPIVVRPKGALYEIIAGERRYRAVKALRWETVPTIVKALSDEEARVVSLIENIQRENLNPMEESDAVHTLQQSTGATQEKIGEMIGKSRSYVANLLRLQKLPASVQDKIRQGLMSAGHGKVLVGKKDAEERSEDIVKHGRTVRDTESPVSSDMQAIETSLSSSLKTKVTLKSRGEKGAMTIHFSSLADLNRIIDKLI